MATLLKGAPVAAALTERAAAEAAALKEKGIAPTLAILRVGAREDDLSYERGAMKRCGQADVAVKSVVLPETVDSGDFFETLEQLNRDDGVHGILLLRPLPGQIDGERARNAIAPEKDVDGCTDGSLVGVFTDTPLGFPPCTAQAALEILDYYGIDPKGKRAAVIGRSLVVGRPAAMLLLHRDATVTICHTKTADLAAAALDAELLIVCAGKPELLGGDYFHPGQTVVDVGIHWNGETQKLCGDVRFTEAERVVDAITPVPGGVGAVTTAVLVSHVVEAARRTTR